MHRIVATEGVVLRKRGVGEANTLVAILSLELGLVRASARSARLAKSKLRYGLETMTEGRFSLVKGRYEWKVVGVERLSREGLAQSAASRRAFGRVARLLLRLIHGEEPVPALYHCVRAGFAALAEASSESLVEHIECVLVLRILAHLGYVPHHAALQPFVDDDQYGPELVAAAAATRALLIRTINESLGATGL